MMGCTRKVVIIAIEIEYIESARVIKINFMYRLTHLDSAVGKCKNNTVQIFPALWAERRGLYMSMVLAHGYGNWLRIVRQGFDLRSKQIFDA